MASARARWSRTTLTGNRGRRERREGTSRLIGERRAAVRGALDTQQQHGHIEAGGVTRGVRRSQWKLAIGESWPAFTVQGIYRIATRFIFKITLKFVW